MKFDLLSTIIKVSSFIVNEEYLVHIDKTNSLFINQKLIQKYVISVNFLNNNIEFFTEERVTYIIKDFKVFKKINGAIITNSFFKHSFLLSNYKNSFYDVELFYIIDNELIKKDDFLHKINFGSNHRLENNFIFQSSLSKISSLSLLTGDYEWENNLSKHGEIRKILGLVNEKLWVILYETETRKKQLVSLHTATGKIIDIIDATLPLHDWHIALLEETQTIVSIYGKISTHQKADSPFVEICAITGAVLRNERIESLFQANLKLGQWCYSNHKIYFTAATDTINSTHIGVLDYTTLNLEWFTVIKDRKAGIKDLQVTENKIYALDQGGQLFIFEKEKVVNLKESSE